MFKNLSPNKNKGFTIIEVVLVLAIAGLIFLMVFLALPALQRSQKDTQRRDQLSMFLTQLTQYQANNRNRIPTCDDNSAACNIGIGDSATTGQDTGEINLKNAATGNWEYFYKNYLLAQGDTFEDPNGGPYKLEIVTCGANDSTDGSCSKQRNVASFEGNGADAGSATTPPTQNTAPQNYWVLVTRNSECDGEVVKYNAGARRVTVAYKLEGGGTFCQGN